MKEIDFCGIYLPPFFLSLLIAGGLYLALHRGLDRVAIQRWVWNRAVFEAALFIILLALVTFFIMNEPAKFPWGEQWLRRFFNTAFTVLIAVLLGVGLWRYYMLSPWTRDGRVRVETVNIATEIYGKVSEINVTENQYVHQGDVLFVIDPEEFKLDLAKAEATVESRKQEMLIQQELSERRSHLSLEAVSKEEQQTSASATAVAEAAYAEAVAERDLAKLNLDRTIIRSPVNGYVDNLRLRVGDYAVIGQTKLTVIDADSFWVSGYFEETKLARIHEGDRAVIKFMGFSQDVTGHVESISRGIADDNGGTDTQGLANVNPVFYWVRLAQRIPVRIHIDEVPKGVLLAAGQTCTIEIQPEKKS